MHANGSLPAYMLERDACGIGFVAHRYGERSHDVLCLALKALANHAHRGAVADDGKSGDGAGVLTQIPYTFFARELDRLGARVPPSTDLAVGMLFLDRDPTRRRQAQGIVERIWQDMGGTVLAWREVPVNLEALGRRALDTRPHIVQVFLRRPDTVAPGYPFERALYLARRRMEKAAHAAGLRFYVASLSGQTIVYKGLLRAPAVTDFYPDLQDPDYTTAIAVFHQRYSTNTFPTWERAQPFRLLCHNGEINTLQGNITWMRAREADLASPLWGEHIEDLKPVIDLSGSDSAMLDNVLELLVRSGRDIRHAMLMLIPEAWEHVDDYPPERRAFYHYHAMLMEPWDGPAAVSFTDGRIAGTILDRNGLRPSRFVILKNGLVMSASEAGSIPAEEHQILVKGRLGPGEIIAVDTETGDVLFDDEVTAMFAGRRPYQRWLEENLIRLADVRMVDDGHQPPSTVQRSSSPLHAAFGWTKDDLAYVVRPMVRDGKEPIGAMGDDTPLAALSKLPRPLFHYFKQRFAEVTNPPIDPLREYLVMSLTMRLGPRANLLEEREDATRLLEVHTPILREEDMATLEALAAGRVEPRQNAIYRKGIARAGEIVRLARLSTLWPVAEGPAGMARALDDLCRRAEQAVRDGATVLILSDKGVDESHAPIPSLLATAAVHHHLIRAGLRMRASLIVETGEARETHHVAALIGYGASGVHPYLALATARALGEEESRRDPTMTPERAEANLVQALEKGLLKIMSKMGIATLDAYCGAQIFEAIGLSHDLVERYFPGTPNRLGGITLDVLAEDVLAWHRAAFADSKAPRLNNVGFYKPRRGGEAHLFTPETARALQEAVRVPDVLGDGFQEGYERYKAFVRMVESVGPIAPHHLLDVRSDREPISIDEVEPVESIVQRFSTAAMSHGALSREAHETLAIAMNRLAALRPKEATHHSRASSNSGEGGEDESRYGTERNSGIKQVASGRFGVTPAYLMSAHELQIKMAQGSKPGEGGHLPGHKVTQEIARQRYATPGTPLISPPPHHDIYSIEDLAQLIFDLKQINPEAAISVKLVAQTGVGTIAAGVAKGHADVILISGHSGGTGASPWSSIKNAGLPWELGLVETQQTLVATGLRERVRVRVDGGFVTGRDVIMAALLGADEYSLGTAAMIAEGCIMARVCNKNTCPVGVASQRPDLRAKFPGKPEQVMAYFLFVAQEVREFLARMGYRSLDEVIGRTDLLEQVVHGREAGFMAWQPLLEGVSRDGARRNTRPANPLPERSPLGDRLWEDAREAVETQRPLVLHYRITNVDRTVGARLAGEIARRYGNVGLPEGTITVVFQGSAGQSFGAFNIRGVHLYLIGEANDYVGKGMHGGEIVLRPSYAAKYDSHKHVILGNTALYGATGGRLFAAGRAGERFAVRNSGAVAVVEGVGDHGCEYMTGGVVVVLGETGYNFAAGMTGGRAYVYDPRHVFLRRLNRDLVTVRRVPLGEQPGLKELIREHYEKTGSVRAASILRHWPLAVRDFWQVIPKQALEQERETAPATRVSVAH